VRLAQRAGPQRGIVGFNGATRKGYLATVVSSVAGAYDEHDLCLSWSIDQGQKNRANTRVTAQWSSVARNG